ncbi:hypothetical protein [Acinetobacter sp. NIPH 1958]|nr:hypothetical protein [Acinetobacter sp. NIPH 1958]
MNNYFNYFCVAMWSGAGFAVGVSFVVAILIVLFRKDKKDEN